MLDPSGRHSRKRNARLLAQTRPQACHSAPRRLGAGEPRRGAHGAVSAGAVGRDDVTELGAVLVGDADGRRSAGDITLFDSTGLAIQDLAIAKAAYARAGKLDLQQLEL